MEQVAELARRALAGEAGALESLVAVFRRKVYQYSYLNCGNRDDAEEVAQETLIKICEHLHELREPEHVKTWVYRIARNICLTRRRRSEFAPCEEMSLEAVPGHWQDMVPDSRELPEDAAYHHELRRILAHVIHGLPEKYRIVVMLRDVEEMTVEETARILDLSESVVKTRLHRARAAMRRRLEDSHFLSPISRK